MTIRHVTHCVFGWVVFVSWQPTSLAQTTPALDKINNDFRREIADANIRRIDRLTTLAAAQAGAESDQTYTEIFKQAIAQGNFRAAETAAIKLLAVGTTDPNVEYLAGIVNIMAQADRGSLDDSYASLVRVIQKEAALARQPNFEAKTILLLGEGSTGAMLKAGRSDLALKACELIEASSRNPEVREVFHRKKLRVAEIGKPASLFEGLDLDGKPITLAEFRGRPVLLIFWASWCPSNASEAPRFIRAIKALGPKAPVVIGVNLDAVGSTKDEALAAARRFVLDEEETWRSIADGEPIAKAFMASDIPANVLISADGKIFRIDVAADDLERSITALNPPK